MSTTSSSSKTNSKSKSQNATKRLLSELRDLSSSSTRADASSQPDSSSQPNAVSQQDQTSQPDSSSQPYLPLTADPTSQPDQSSQRDPSSKSDASSGQQPISGFERIGPVSDEDLFQWEAVMTGDCVELRGTGYEYGRWLLAISIPKTYPLTPPTITFRTPITHPNIHPTTGEICLDLLKTPSSSTGGQATGSWTPAYTITTTLESIRDLLSLSADPESPLNVDVGVLLRRGDWVAVEGLVRWGCGRERWGGW